MRTVCEQCRCSGGGIWGGECGVGVTMAKPNNSPLPSTLHEVRFYIPNLFVCWLHTCICLIIVSKLDKDCIHGICIFISYPHELTLFHENIATSQRSPSFFVYSFRDIYVNQKT